MTKIIVAVVIVAGLGFAVWRLAGKPEKPPAAGGGGGDQPTRDEDPGSHAGVGERLPPGGQVFPMEEPTHRRAPAGTGGNAAAAQPNAADRAGQIPGGGGQAAPAEKPRFTIEIEEPPETATEPVDKTARLAAQTYKTVVKAMQLQPEQEEKFREVLRDSQQNYREAMRTGELAAAAARARADDPALDPTARAEAAAQANQFSKKAWDNQRTIGDDIMRELLSEAQFRTYSTLVQNPLFMSNGMRFKPGDQPGTP